MRERRFVAQRLCLMFQHLTENVALEHRGSADEATHHGAHHAGGDDVGAAEVEALDRSLRPEPSLLVSVRIMR